MTVKHNDDTTLETLIDRYGLHTVVKQLGFICGEKAEHIAVNWQDTSLAKQWENAASVLDDTAAKIQAVRLP